MGESQLAIPLGLIFGWPNIVLVMMFAFVNRRRDRLVRHRSWKEQYEGYVAVRAISCDCLRNDILLGFTDAQLVSLIARDSVKSLEK